MGLDSRVTSFRELRYGFPRTASARAGVAGTGRAVVLRLSVLWQPTTAKAHARTSTMAAPHPVKLLEELLEGHVGRCNGLDLGPTKLLPGDPRRDEVIRSRLREGQPSVHPHDARMPQGWYWRSARGKNGRENYWALYDGLDALIMEVRLESGTWRITTLNEYALHEEANPRNNSPSANSA